MAKTYEISWRHGYFAEDWLTAEDGGNVLAKLLLHLARICTTIWCREYITNESRILTRGVLRFDDTSDATVSASLTFDNDYDALQFELMFG